MKLGLRYNMREDDWLPVYNEQEFRHTWVIGKTGQGKSTYLENCAIEKILAGEGVAIDPHEDSIENIKKHIPPEKIILKEYAPKQVVLFDPSDRNYPVGFNILNHTSRADIPLIASTIVDTVRSAWKLDNMITPYIELYLTLGCQALLEVPGGSLVALEKLLTDKNYRADAMRHVSDGFVRKFWEFNFEEVMPDKEQRTTVLSTLNRITQLIADPRIRNILGQTKSTIDLKNIMDTGKCLLISLPQGKLGEGRSSLIGALLASQMHLAGLRRSNRRPFHIIADEFQNYGTSTFSAMLSGIRKFGISLTLSNQYLDQLTPSLRSALIGTVGTIVSFRLGVTDAEIISKEMGLEPSDLVNLEPYYAYAQLGYRDGRRDVDRLYMPEIDSKQYGNTPQLIKKYSRSKYATKRPLVEKRLNNFINYT